MTDARFQSWSFRWVERSPDASQAVRVFYGMDGEVAAFQRWNRDEATRQEIGLADLCCSLYPPVDDELLATLPELPADLAVDGAKTELAARFLRHFLAEPEFARMVSSALSDWDDFQRTGSLEARALFEMAVREAADIVGGAGSSFDAEPKAEGADTEAKSGTRRSGTGGS